MSPGALFGLALFPFTIGAGVLIDALARLLGF